MDKTVLIPTDGSEYSTISLEYGIHLARAIGARIRGLCIIDIKVIQGPLLDDISGFTGISTSQDVVLLIEKSLNERADAILKSFHDRCGSGGVEAETIKRTGIVSEIIVEEAEGADCILMAQRGEHTAFIRRGLLGSTSESVVRMSGKPVIITPLEYREIRGLGLAYDGSGAAERALDIAADMAGTAGWPLSVISISGDPDHTRDLQARIDAALSGGETAYTVTIRDGKEEQEIISFTETPGVDMLIMGAYGHSRIRELILGSTTSYVIRNSTIPVLLIR
ncbi:MAG: universal stress protein [Deltaproteobacteria bacterium]|nr:universal stress protein [Deltaproteobacteria bacterium]